MALWVFILLHHEDLTLDVLAHRDCNHWSCLLRKILSSMGTSRPTETLGSTNWSPGTWMLSPSSLPPSPSSLPHHHHWWVLQYLRGNLHPSMVTSMRNEHIIIFICLLRDGWYYSVMWISFLPLAHVSYHSHWRWGSSQGTQRILTHLPECTEAINLLPSIEFCLPYYLLSWTHNANFTLNSISEGFLDLLLSLLRSQNPEILVTIDKHFPIV